MTKILKRNMFAIISFLILIVWLAINVVQYVSNHNNQVKIYNQYAEKYQEPCKTDKDFCDMKKPEYPDTMTVFYQILLDRSLYNIYLFAPLFILIPCIWFFHRKMKTGYYKNELTRMSYRKYILGSYKDILKNTWIFPVFVLILFIISYMISGHFDYEKTKRIYGMDISTFNLDFIKIWPIFLLVYIVTVWLHSIFYANLSLIFSKKNTNILITIILSYLSFVGIEFVMEIIGAICSRVFDIHGMTVKLSLFNIWIHSESFSLPVIILYALILVGITSMVVYFLYRNKEEVIHTNEEHN